MNTEDIIEFAESLLGETLDADLALNLAENAKNLIEGAKPWQMLIKEDASETFGSGDNYLTEKDLPDDFLYDYKLYLGVEVDDDYSDFYNSVSLMMRRRFKSTSSYCIDYANKKFYICDSVSKTYTIYLYYIYETPALALDTSPVWPAKFHRLISFLMVELNKSGIDADEINVGQALAHNRMAQMLWQEMIYWDQKLKLQAMNHQTPIAGSGSARRTDVIDINE